MGFFKNKIFDAIFGFWRKRNRFDVQAAAGVILNNALSVNQQAALDALHGGSPHHYERFADCEYIPANQYLSTEYFAADMRTCGVDLIDIKQFDVPSGTSPNFGALARCEWTSPHEQLVLVNAF